MRKPAQVLPRPRSVIPQLVPLVVVAIFAVIGMVTVIALIVRWVAA